MTRETKIGMIVATSFLSLVGVVVGTKYYKKDIPGSGGGDGTPGLQAFAQSGQAPFPTKGEPPATAKQEPAATPKPGPITQTLFTEPLPEVSPPPANLNFGTAGSIEAPRVAVPPPVGLGNDFKLPEIPNPVAGVGDAAKDAAQSLQDKIREQERNAKNNIAAAKNQFFDNLNQGAADAKDQLKDKANKALEGLPALPEIPGVAPPIMIAQETAKPAQVGKPEIPVAPPLPAAPNFGGATLPPVGPPTVKPTTDAPSVGKPEATPLPVFGQQPPTGLPAAPPAASTLPPFAPPVQQGFPPDRKDDVPPSNGGFPALPQATGTNDFTKIPQIPGPSAVPANPQGNGFTVPAPQQTNGFNDPAKIPGTNDPRPIPQIPGPPNGATIPAVSVPSIPVVKTDTPTAYICQGNENYALIALRNYGGDGYARALEQYNRELPGAAENVRAVPAQLSPGTKLWLPSVNYLRDRYGQLVSITTPPATTSIPSAPTQPPLGSQIGIGDPRPAAPPIPPTQPNQGAANATPFRVPMGGLYIAQIADRQLGNPQRWIEIYRLNPALDPTQPIREGTEIRIPAR